MNCQVLNPLVVPLNTAAVAAENRRRRATDGRGKGVDTYAHVPAAVQLRTAISILTNVAADRDWGAGEVVYVRPAGRLQIGDHPEMIDAATVYMAARGLVGALLDDLSATTGRDLEEIVGPWLLALEMSQAVADIEVDELG